MHQTKLRELQVWSRQLSYSKTMEYYIIQRLSCPCATRAKTKIASACTPLCKLGTILRDSKPCRGMSGCRRTHQDSQNLCMGFLETRKKRQHTKDFLYPPGQGEPRSTNFDLSAENPLPTPPLLLMLRVHSPNNQTIQVVYL